MSVPLPVLLLIVACGLGWAGFDLTRKLLLREIPPVALMFLLTVGSATLFAVWMVAQGAAGPGPGYLLPALGSVMLNIVASLLFLEGMRIAPLSVTIPLLSLTPAFAALLAIPLLGERPSAPQACGILLVVAGAIGLHWGAGGDGDRAGHPGALKGALMVALTALLWSLTVPLDKLAVERANAPLHGVVLTAGMAAGVLLALAVQGRLRDLGRVRRAPGVYVLALVVSSLALALQLLALPQAYVATVETLKRGIGNFAALFSGWFFFHEPVTPRKVVAVGVMAIGVGLILT
ncbi:MAG TPA: DMT family transporter [Thermoanaerobaculia bacterium]|jgi:drug/metabolite transporter (DMT)-like permease